MFKKRGLPGKTGEPGTNGVGIVAGGTTGQVLKKKTNTDYDTEWANESGGGGASDPTLPIDTDQVIAVGNPLEVINGKYQRALISPVYDITASDKGENNFIELDENRLFSLFTPAELQTTAQYLRIIKKVVGGYEVGEAVLPTGYTANNFSNMAILKVVGATDKVIILGQNASNVLLSIATVDDKVITPAATPTVIHASTGSGGYPKLFYIRDNYYVACHRAGNASRAQIVHIDPITDVITPGAVITTTAYATNSGWEIEQVNSNRLLLEFGTTTPTPNATILKYIDIDNSTPPVLTAITDADAMTIATVPVSGSSQLSTIAISADGTRALSYININTSSSTGRFYIADITGVKPTLLAIKDFDFQYNSIGRFAVRPDGKIIFNLLPNIATGSKFLSLLISTTGDLIDIVSMSYVPYFRNTGATQSGYRMSGIYNVTNDAYTLFVADCIQTLHYVNNQVRESGAFFAGLAVSAGVADDLIGSRKTNILTGLSGLLPGYAYYYDYNVGLTTIENSISSIYIGVALSETSILLDVRSNY